MGSSDGSAPRSQAKLSACVSQELSPGKSQVTFTKRTPASTSRRAMSALEPNSVRP